MTKSVLGVIVLLLLFGGCFAYGQDSAQSFEGPPRVREIKFDPPQPMTGQQVKLNIRLEGAAVRAEVKWSINGEEVETTDYDGLGKPVKLDKETKAGDKVSVAVIPYDGIGASGTEAKGEITIAPAPPIVKVGEQKIQGNVYTARVDAVDPQGGPVKFTINQAPEGLTIDSQGNVTWRISEGVAGSFPVVIAASDERGGHSVVSFTIDLRWQKRR
jgi:hypothetical protein